MTNWKLLLLLGAALVGVGLLCRFVGAPDRELWELTILHTNDVHAHYDPLPTAEGGAEGGVARLKTAIDEVRGILPNVLLLDAGDQFQGTLFFTVAGAEGAAEVMNALEYHAMCIGNHEFDAGPSELAKFIGLAQFPVLSANTDALSDADLAGLLLPYALAHFDLDRTPVGVIGLTTEHAAISSSAGPNVRFLDATTTAQRTVQELERAGVHVIIALTHLGYARDLDLARRVSGIDVIVGGHSHTLLGPFDGAIGAYPTVVMSPCGEPVLVVTAGESGRFLGRLDVDFTDDGVVKTHGGGPIPLDERIPEDDGMVELLARYRPAIEDLMGQTVGSTDVDLDGAREMVRTRETNLGNLICDVMLHKAECLGATLALQNGGGIRASIPAGEITMGQVLEVLPYGNQISVLSVTGAQIVEAIENGISGIEQGAGRFPQVAGMRYAFDPVATPGARVAWVETWDAASGAYAPIDPDAIYTLATNGFLARGGDGYAVFAEAADRYETGWLLSDALAEFLMVQSPVSPRAEGRVQAAAP